VEFADDDYAHNPVGCGEHWQVSLWQQRSLHGFSHTVIPTKF
jgi:hypothetical protein